MKCERAIQIQIDQHAYNSDWNSRRCQISVPAHGVLSSLPTPLTYAVELSMLTLGDGRRDMGKARANRNTSAKSVVSTPTSHAHVNKARKNKISRVRGRLSVQVGRAETRDKLSLGPPQRHQSILTPYISGEKMLS